MKKYAAPPSALHSAFCLLPSSFLPRLSFSRSITYAGLMGLAKKCVAPTWGKELMVSMEVSPLTTKIGTAGPSCSRRFIDKTSPFRSGRCTSMIAAEIGDRPARIFGPFRRIDGRQRTIRLQVLQLAHEIVGENLRRDTLIARVLHAQHRRRVLEGDSFRANAGSRRGKHQPVIQ